MNGYLECLINEYKRKFDKAFGMEKALYKEFIVSLNEFKQYMEGPKEEKHRKHVALDFVGTMPGFIEYLKSKTKEGE